MADLDERWDLVGAAIAERIRELGMTKAQVTRDASVSDTSLTAYIGGQPIRRVDKRTGLCRALGWSIDSIDRILDGKAPHLIDREPTPPGGAAAQPLNIAALYGQLSPEKQARADAYLRGLLDGSE